MGLKQVTIAEIILHMERGKVTCVEVQSCGIDGVETRAVDALAWLFEREREELRVSSYAYQWHRALQLWQFFFTDIDLAMEFKMSWG
jgi:hypothetical protein